MEIKDVENLASLARIDLPEGEKTQILKDMESILAYVRQVEELDIQDTVSKSKVNNVWREDELEERDFSIDSITTQFPNKSEGFLKVKKIL